VDPRIAINGGGIRRTVVVAMPLHMAASRRWHCGAILISFAVGWA